MRGVAIGGQGELPAEQFPGAEAQGDAASGTVGPERTQALLQDREPPVLLMMLAGPPGDLGEHFPGSRDAPLEVPDQVRTAFLDRGNLALHGRGQRIELARGEAEARQERPLCYCEWIASAQAGE